MRKIFLGILFAFLLFLTSTNNLFAQSEPYIIKNFHSEIDINQDASVTVTETIDVNFNVERHGIFRYVPVVYHTTDKVINSRLQVISVTDKENKRYKYEVDREGDNVEIKIGDPDEYVTGVVSYVITYRARNIIQRFEDHDELYWNVAGSGWDTQINSASATVRSQYAGIENIQCFAGLSGSNEKCETLTHNDNSAEFVSGQALGNGRDMTIVLALNKNNTLNFTKTLGDYIYGLWGYPLAIMPLLIIGFFWLKHGRDKRYTSDNIYYEPTDKSTKNVPLFGRREFLPMVYSPINGLTPAVVGTLIDERVDIHDVVAEIVELGRLGFLKIEKIDKKWAKDDYLITRKKIDTSKLQDYQKYLFESLFSYANDKGEVKLSELKKKFYTKLETFRNKLYTYIQEQKYFDSRPDHARILWLVIVLISLGISFFGTIIFIENTREFWPLVILLVSTLPAILLAWNMPRKTALGYSLYRQTKGLAFYLKKGKWRHVVNEKHLFLEEMLPLAISLGVVGQLARDMEELGVAPPSYFNAHSAVWASSLTSFNASASSSFVSAPSSSGGSGFSGGSSGGGFGGGGGGSW